jgi:DNA-binding response OmpR family regulator
VARPSTRRRSAPGPILLVEDDPAIRRMMQMALEDEGYEVVAVSDGFDALGAIEQRRPGLILLDLRMPRMNGWEFAESYRALPGPRAPIVALTAGRDLSAKAAEIGADAYLGKPFDLEQLIAIVRTVTGRRPPGR